MICNVSSWKVRTNTSKIKQHCIINIFTVRYSSFSLSFQSRCWYYGYSEGLYKHASDRSSVPHASHGFLPVRARGIVISNIQNRACSNHICENCYLHATCTRQCGVICSCIVSLHDLLLKYQHITSLVTNHIDISSLTICNFLLDWGHAEWSEVQ